MFFSSFLIIVLILFSQAGILMFCFEQLIWLVLAMFLTFSLSQYKQASDRYFLDSGDKIRYFFEVDAFDEAGNLQMDKHKCMNKIGHALHWINPAFRKVSFSQKVQYISRCLKLRDPAIVQGMYIFKQPGIGILEL